MNWHTINGGLIGGGGVLGPVVPVANTQADLLQWGLAALTVEMTAHASQPIVYARGAQSVDTRATFGSKLLKLDDGQGGLRMEWTDMDF